ncbi:aldo/keto reductase [Herbiconiux sp. P16]|uniref:aldo/keto reductase n=1 Tax=Herbiconiux wuyangfengii TaxID=3342794 RepID=UPI0035B94B3F
MTGTPIPISAGSGNWLAFLVGEDTPLRESIDLVHALFEEPRIRVLDTSNNYGGGESERRIGLAIQEYGGLPDDFLIVSKADRDMTTGDFSGSRMRQSLEESLGRMGIDRFPMMYLHDPENTTWERAMADDGPVAALVEARDAGQIDVLGVAGGPAALMGRYVETGIFDALITHNRYTLVDRSADELLTLAADRGLHVTNAAPYGGGLLTGWPPPLERYAYAPVSDGIRSSAERIAEVCARHGVPMAAVALGFSLRDPRIDRTIVGMRTVGDLTATIELAETPIPPAVWDELDDVSLATAEWQDPR